MACYIEHMDNGNVAFLCGDLGQHCSNEKCGAVGQFLCDYPVGDGKTCDAALCQSHAFEVAPNIHYCHGHLLLWKEFRLRNGEFSVLKNVVPFNIGGKP